ncbi:MAG: hypothetical protein ACOCWR_04620 [Oceanidesulfovibrio sp.]
MHTALHHASRKNLAPMLFAVVFAILLAPSPAGAYDEKVQQCIDKYTSRSQPRLASNTLRAACLCQYGTMGISRCSQWPEERIDCVVDLMPQAMDNNDARRVNTYCKRKAGLRFN